MNNSPFPPGTLVVAYLRDSGHEDQELSIDQQEARIRAYCDSNKLQLTQVYIDAAAPGSSVIGRNAFQEMIRHFRDQNCAEAGILLWKFNRFARDIDDAQFYKADLRRRGYIIHSINDPVPEGINGRFFEAAIDWMNARYLEDLRTDIKRGQHHLVEQFGALGGVPPRGFKREAVQIGERRDGRPHIVHRWVPDQDMIPVIRLAFEMRAQDASYNEINQATHLYNSTNAYAHFFSNRIYIGEMVFADRVITQYCEPIIDRELWDRVQGIQARHEIAVRKSEDHPRRKKSSFILSGLVYCAQCNSPMNADIVQFRSTHQYRYEYYSCSGAARNNGCIARKIPRAPLEKAILDSLINIVLDPDVIEARYQQLIEDANRSREKSSTEKAQLNNRLNHIRKRISNLTDIIAEQGLAARSLLEKLDDLEREEINIKNRLDELKRLSTRPAVTLEDLKRQAMRLREVLDHANAAEIKSLLDATIEKIIVELVPDTNTILGIMYYYEPPAIKNKDNQDFYGLTQCPRRDSNSQPRR